MIKEDTATYAESGRRQMVGVQGWSEELKRLVPTN